MSNLNAEELSDVRPDDQLAFSKIKEEIEIRAKKQADQLISEAEEKANSILEAAKDEATKIKQAIVAKATNEASSTKVREVSRKKLALKMDYLATREEILEDIQLEAKSKIQAFTKSKKYSAFLNKLVTESGVSIGGGDLVLHLRSEDKSLFTKASLDELSKTISEMTNIKTKISLAKSDLNTLGGLKIIRQDNKVFIDNSFETRLDRSKESIREGLQQLLN